MYTYTYIIYKHCVLKRFPFFFLTFFLTQSQMCITSLKQNTQTQLSLTFHWTKREANTLFYLALGTWSLDCLNTRLFSSSSSKTSTFILAFLFEVKIFLQENVKDLFLLPSLHLFNSCICTLGKNSIEKHPIRIFCVKVVDTFVVEWRQTNFNLDRRRHCIRRCSWFKRTKIGNRR